jgi:HD superfamily phosphodiesterase
MTGADVYDRIYAAAEPYWQTRDNDVHVPGAYALCKELLASYPEADEEVVLPAILLHDVGYWEVPEDEQLKGLAGAPVGWDPDVTRRHEIAGARIAGELLRALDYDEEKTRRIQDIIDGHDSRVEALSLEDAIVKDADKLWRFTEDGIRISSAWMSRSYEEFTAYVEAKIDSWMLTDAGKLLAGETLARSRRSLGVRDGS